jgi:hypothetical protein
VALRPGAATPGLSLAGRVPGLLAAQHHATHLPPWALGAPSYFAAAVNGGLGLLCCMLLGASHRLGARGGPSPALPSLHYVMWTFITPRVSRRDCHAGRSSLCFSHRHAAAAGGAPPW